MLYEISKLFQIFFLREGEQLDHFLLVIQTQCTSLFLCTYVLSPRPRTFILFALIPFISSTFFSVDQTCFFSFFQRAPTQDPNKKEPKTQTTQRTQTTQDPRPLKRKTKLDGTQDPRPKQPKTQDPNNPRPKQPKQPKEPKQLKTQDP